MNGQDSAKALGASVLAAFCGSVLAAVTGCGGGAALLHPAHTLKASEVSFGAGVSHVFPVGDISESIDAARAVGDPGTLSPPEREALMEGALAEAALGPGLAPWVSARVGLDHNNEGGLTYTGRSVRIDGRHSFEWDAVALSLGIGGTAVVARPGSDAPGEPGSPGRGEVAAVDSGAMSGWGLDAPATVGWQSDLGVIRVWGGVRARYERLGGPVVLRTALEQTADAEATRFGAGALVGIAAGVHPLRVAVELSGSYESVSTSAELESGDRMSADLAGVSLSPAAAVIAEF